MKAIIWKELREHLKWAVLGSVAISLVLAFAATDVKNGNRNPFGNQDPTLMVMGVLLACLLGFLHVFMESRRDQWAFLVHRPTSRTRLFVGKALAAALLYLPAMVVPWTLFVLWCARPGRIAAPFEWRLTLPGYVDILTGFAYYFAGMQVGLRPARWYASRGLPLALPVVLTVLVVVVPELWHALALIVVATAVTGVAAWGSFLTGGAYLGQPRAMRFAWGFSLAVGIGIVGVSVGVAVSELARPLSYGPHTREGHYLAKDGTILRVKRRGPEVVSVVDLEGNPVEKYRDPKLRNREGLEETLVDSWAAVPVRDDALLDWNRRPGGYRSIRRYYGFTSWRAAPRSRWYYFYRDGCFLGYDLTTRRAAGRMCPQGYVPAGAAAPNSGFGRCLGMTRDADVGVFTTGVYRLRWEARQVERLFSPRLGEDILAASVRDDRIALRTRTTVYLLDGQGRQRLEMPVDNDGGRFNLVSLAASGEGKPTFACYRPLIHDRRKPESSLIVQLGPDGSVLRRAEVPGIPAHPRIGWALPVVWSVTPLVAEVGSWAVEALERVHRQYADPWAGLRRDHFLWPRLTLVLITAVIFAVVNLLLCRRRTFGRGAVAAWTVWGFLLGPTGLLLLLCLQDWPARVACTSCAKPRRVDHDTCTHCAAPFPTPALDGTEVFD